MNFTFYDLPFMAVDDERGPRTLVYAYACMAMRVSGKVEEITVFANLVDAARARLSVEGSSEILPTSAYDFDASQTRMTVEGRVFDFSAGPYDPVFPGAGMPVVHTSMSFATSGLQFDYFGSFQFELDASYRFATSGKAEEAIGSGGNEQMILTLSTSGLFIDTFEKVFSEEGSAIQLSTSGLYILGGAFITNYAHYNLTSGGKYQQTTGADVGLYSSNSMTVQGGVSLQELGTMVRDWNKCGMQSGGGAHKLGLFDKAVSDSNRQMIRTGGSSLASIRVTADGRERRTTNGDSRAVA